MSESMTSEQVKIPLVYSQLINEKGYTGSKGLSMCWGQMKLLVSESALFYSMIQHGLTDWSRYIVVYVGSSPGSHLPVLFDLFAGLKWLLIDPSPASDTVNRMSLQSLISDNVNVTIWNKLFTDDTVNEVLSFANGREIIYINDMRKICNAFAESTDEDQIAIDMSYQLRWGLMMNPLVMWLKFRPPYIANDKMVAKISIDDIFGGFGQEGVSMMENMRKFEDDTHFIYLSGDIFIQAFHPNNSTETRLLSIRNQSTGIHLLTVYDALSYDRKMSYYNTEIRDVIYTKCVSCSYNNVDCKCISDYCKNFIGFEPNADCLLMIYYLRCIGLNLNDVLNRFKYLGIKTNIPLSRFKALNRRDDNALNNALLHVNKVIREWITVNGGYHSAQVKSSIRYVRDTCHLRNLIIGKHGDISIVK